MAKLPIQVTSLGVNSDPLGQKYHIYFLSIYNSKKLFLGDNILTENLSEAIETDDMSEAVETLGELLGDEDFLEYLEAELCL